MFRRGILTVALALALVGAGVAVGTAIDGDWGRDHDAVVIQGGGNDATTAGQTIVVRDGHDHGFFPFGLLFAALVVILVVSLVRRGGWRRGGWGGPGGRQAWLDDWHRRAHERDPGSGGGPTPA